MKQISQKLTILLAFVSFLTFTACQEEFEEVGGDNQQTITASSTTAALIKNTSSNDGSFDNIVDGASCLAIKFPYVVEVNGIQITIDAREDLHAIEEIFDEVDIDEDVLDIIFPITITLADFTEIVIENKDALLELANSCIEGGDDDDIECIDFVYPLTFFTFNADEQQTGEVMVSNDEELRKFFGGLEDDQLVSLDFPVTLKKFDGTEIVVSSNAELAQALERAKDECDEDDDDDYNDDDFDEERFDFCLTECPWAVKEVIRNSQDQTGQYPDFTMIFEEGGRVAIQEPTGNIVYGEWSSSFTEDGPLLTLEFESFPDFNAEWLVYEIGDHTIKLYQDDGNKIILRQHCDGDDNGDDGNETSPDTLRETLKECEWIIKKVIKDQEEVDRLLGYEFNFNGDGTVTLGNGINTLEGTWEVGYNNDQVLSLLINIGQEPDVSFDWPLRHLDNHRLKFSIEETGHEMVLLRVCDDSADDMDVREIRNIAMGGGWTVAMYSENGMEMMDSFNEMDFNFSMMHQVEVSVNDDPIASGLWRVARDAEENLIFYLNIQDSDTLQKLTESWYIVSTEANRIELAYEEEGLTKILVFEKP